MQKLKPMKNVVDFAHSFHKCEQSDLLLLGGCRFYLGTNSGLATIPGIFGVPMVLTNWVPLTLPLWFGNDLMIPKLVMDKRTGKCLPFEKLFASNLAAIQNVADVPAHLEFVPNTPQEINELVLEMFAQLDNKVTYTDEDEVREAAYREIAEKSGSYWGGRMGRDFLRTRALL